MKFDSRRSSVLARNGMVVTSQPLAAMSGLRMLMDGGNAIDAAVATAATLNVVEPGSTGAGGDVFALVWFAKEKRVQALNASGRSPAAASLDELRAKGFTEIPAESAYSITVPGAVSGWAALLERYGSMPFSKVLEPAIHYASEGYPVSEIISTHWIRNFEKLNSHPSGTELLLDGGRPQPGDVMRMPELANTLQTIAEGGADAFYRGPLAEKIASYVQQQGGWLNSEDLADHQATWDEPISTEYRGIRCWQCPPNGQGVNALMALNIAEGFDIESMGFQTTDTYHHLIECVRLAFADGFYHVTDPEKMRVATSDLISKRYAESRRGLIDPGRALSTVSTGLALTRGDTVYLTCVDGEGNACSLINSVYMGFGTGLVVPTTGLALHCRGISFSLDPEHPNALEPRKRPFHTLIPGIVTRDDELWLSYGVMGTLHQAQGHLQVLTSMIDFGLSPQEALNAPRFSVRPGQSWDDLNLEDLVPAGVVEGLRGRGHTVTVREPNALFFGGGQIIERDAGSGVLRGGAEPRSDGFAVGW